MAWEQGDINSDTKTDRMKDNYETCHLDNRLNLSGKEERRQTLFFWDELESEKGIIILCPTILHLIVLARVRVLPCF